MWNLLKLPPPSQAPSSEGRNYPVGIIDKDIEVHFLHYSNFEEAMVKWNNRLNRINMDNFYVVMLERDGCTYEDLLTFDELPLKNKVAFVHKLYPDIKCAFFIPEYSHDIEVGRLTRYQGHWGKREYDCFDWVSFLNKK